MGQPKYIYTSESVLEDMIYRRDGYLCHPGRFLITPTVVRNLINRLYLDRGNAMLGNDWIAFFKQYGKLVRITKTNLLTVLSIGVPMFLKPPKNTHVIQTMISGNEELSKLVCRDYSRSYAEGYPIPKWMAPNVADGQYKAERGQDGDANLKIFAKNLLPVIDRKDYKTVIPAIWWEISGISEYPVDLVGDSDQMVLRYVDAMVDHSAEVDKQFISILIEKLKKDPEEALDRTAVGSVCKLFSANGNNLKIMTAINMLLPEETANQFPKFAAIERALNANVPIRDFGILSEYYNTLWPGQRIIWDMIEKSYQVCDIGTMPERETNPLMDIRNFSTILNRDDASEQVAQWVRSNGMAASWIYANINQISFWRHSILIEGFLKILGDPTWKHASGQVFFIHHRILSTISTIIRTDPERWINQFPELLRYCDRIDPVTINTVIRDATENQKEIFEAVPLRLITQTDIVRMLTIYKGFLKVNRSKGFTSDKNSLLSFQQFFLPIDVMSDLFFRMSKYEYIEEIDDIGMEQELFDYLDPEFNTRKNRMKIWLTQTFRYILYR